MSRVSKKGFQDLKDEELYDFACQVRELIDGYDLLYILPRSEDLNYVEIQDSFQESKLQAEEKIKAILVRFMGKRILTRQERSRMKGEVVPKPNEIYHKRTSNQKVECVTNEELKKLGPTLNRLAEYDKKGKP